MSKKPFDLNSSDYVTEELGNGYFAFTRVTPYTAVEKRIINKQKRFINKNAIKINIDSNDSAETVALKTEAAIRRGFRRQINSRKTSGG